MGKYHELEKKYHEFKKGDRVFIIGSCVKCLDNITILCCHSTCIVVDVKKAPGKLARRHPQVVKITLTSTFVVHPHGHDVKDRMVTVSGADLIFKEHVEGT